jgi:hypothetical protein
MEEVAQAVNKMFAVPIPGTAGYDGEDAIEEGRRVSAKIREELRREGRLYEGPEEKNA